MNPDQNPDQILELNPPKVHIAASRGIRQTTSGTQMFHLVEFAEFFLHSLAIPYCNAWPSRRAADRRFRNEGVPTLSERYVNRFPTDFPTYLARQQLKFWPGYPLYIRACQNRIEVSNITNASSHWSAPPPVDSSTQDELPDNVPIPGSFTEIRPQAAHQPSTETVSPMPTRASSAYENPVARLNVPPTPELPSLPPPPRRGLGAAMRANAAEQRRNSECTEEVVGEPRPSSTADSTAVAGRLVGEKDTSASSPRFSDVYRSSELHDDVNEMRASGLG